MHILHVVGTRPNFVKAAPVMRALSTRVFIQSLVHTGQHYDAAMSDVFFAELEIPAPDVNLGVGSGTHAAQTAEIMRTIEPILVARNPDLVLVYGDVNSTVATALVCSKLPLRLAHVEAGLRSFDRAMPEEINRLVTDQLCDILFTPSEDADLNLLREGVPSHKIHRVGNVMIDSLMRFLPLTEKNATRSLPEKFVLVTLHRPSNVDNSARLDEILGALIEIAGKLDVVFPLHPRTRQRIADLKIDVRKLHLIEPLPYIEFIATQRRAMAVITDSGGIQEETTFLGVPCLTLRKATERPVTVTTGNNTLVGEDREALMLELQKIIAGNPKKGAIPPLWDGRSAERIAEVLSNVIRP